MRQPFGGGIVTIAGASMGASYLIHLTLLAHLDSEEVAVRAPASASFKIPRTSAMPRDGRYASVSPDMSAPVPLHLHGRSPPAPHAYADTVPVRMCAAVP